MERELTAIPLEIKKADILLVYPDFAKNSLGIPTYPENHLGLNRLATYLDEKGYKVKVLNTTGSPKGTEGPIILSNYLSKNKKDFKILGFHLNSWNISHVLKTLKFIQKDFKDRLILFGGPLPTAEPEKVLNLFNSIGYKNLGLVQGYGEFALESIMKKPKRIDKIDKVWSIKKKRLNKGYLQRFSSEELSSLPFLNPKYNTFFQLWYKPFVEENEEKSFSLDTIFSAQGLNVNHGCPFNCSYCSVHIFGRSISEMTPIKAVDELESVAQKTGFFMFTYTNSNLMFVKRDWIVEFCKLLIERNINSYVTWTAYHHPQTLNLLTDEDFELIKKSGCDQIVMGIQSVEPSILKLFNRNPETEKLFKFLTEKIQKAGLEVVIDYIRGVPEENLEKIEEFYDYCIEKKIELREYILKIYPNTDIQNKNINYSDYELIPITGDLAPELDSFAVVPKFSNPKNQILSKKINISNAKITKERKIRVANTYLHSKEEARKLKDELIPKNPFIPEKVKVAMKKMLEIMLNPSEEQKPKNYQNPEKMMKSLILADESAPPMLKEMQKRLKQELGEEKFQKLKEKYESEQ